MTSKSQRQIVRSTHNEQQIISHPLKMRSFHPLT